MNTPIPHFVIVTEGDEEMGENGTIHTAVTDKTGIQKLVTLSEVSSMQEELPTNSTPGGKTGKGEFQCSHCTKSFVLLKSLSRHKKKVHPDIPDDKEGDVLLTDAANRSNEQCITVQDLIVPEAGQTRGRLLVRDEALVSSLAEELKSLTKVTPRKKRKYEISKEHECPVCSKRFATPSLLKRHRVVHTGEKPYQCQQCGRKYSQVERLRRHMGTHTGINIFKCKVCGKQFEEKCRYIDHVRSHIEEKPFECDVCGKVFACRVGLWKHKSIHTGDKRYYGESCGAYRFSCQQCSKQFRLKQDLVRHNRTHTGEAPSKLFPCQFCEKKFSRKVLLETHVRGHTGERPFVCQYCLKRFACKRSRACHIKLHKLGKAQPLEGCDGLETTPAKEPNSPSVSTPPCHCIDCNEQFERKEAFIQHLKDKHNVMYQEDPACAATCTSLSFQTRIDGVTEGPGGEHCNSVQDFVCPDSRSVGEARAITSSEHITTSHSHTTLPSSTSSMPVGTDLRDISCTVTNSAPNEKQSYPETLTMNSVLAAGENLGHASYVETKSAQNKTQPYPLPITVTGVSAVGDRTGLLSASTQEYAFQYSDPFTRESSRKDLPQHFQYQGNIYQDPTNASVQQQPSVTSLLPPACSVESTNVQVASGMPLPQVFVCFPTARTGMESAPQRGKAVQAVVGNLTHETFQSLGQDASQSLIPGQNKETIAGTPRKSDCPTDGLVQTIVRGNPSGESLHHAGISVAELQPGLSHNYLPITQFSAGNSTVSTQPAHPAIQMLVETETPVIPAIVPTSRSGIETVAPNEVLNISMACAGLAPVSSSQPRAMAVGTPISVETGVRETQPLTLGQSLIPINQSTSELNPSLTASSEPAMTMIQQNTNISVIPSRTLFRNTQNGNQDSIVSQLHMPPVVDQPSQSIETYQIIIGDASKDQRIGILREDVSHGNAEHVFTHENVVAVPQRVIREVDDSGFSCDVIGSTENAGGQSTTVYRNSPAPGTPVTSDKGNLPPRTSESPVAQHGTPGKSVHSSGIASNAKSAKDYPKIEDQIRKTLMNNDSYPDRTSSFAPAELLEEFMPSKRSRRKSV